MTNGEKIKAILKPRTDQIRIYGDWVEIEIQSLAINFNCELSWWNAECKEPITENCIACKYDETEEEDGKHCKKCLAGNSQFELDKEFVEPTTKNNLPHCQYTDEEIAKSFIEDVEAVKDQLPCGEQMDFPNTFDEFAKDYGFKDKNEVYTNGSELIPVFRVKQWLEHISTIKNDLALIHTEGLDEEIRCTMCTNHMKSDRGCDGSCVVNKDMYKAVMDAIEKRIQTITNNDLGVDCISRADVLNHLANIAKVKAKSDAQKSLMGRCLFMVESLPSVTPQPRKGHWIDEGFYADGHSEHAFMCSKCEGHYIGYAGDFKWCPYCGSDNREVEE